MERCIFNVYIYSRLESVHQSIKPYAQSMFQKSAPSYFILLAIIDFCNMEGEKNAVKKFTQSALGLGPIHVSA